jgi:tetratricopeptide (TPR) repeat protein
LLKGEELKVESISPSSVSDIFSSLAQEVTQGKLTLDEAVRRIQQDGRIKAMLDEQSVIGLIALAERLANQSPPLAYNIAYLTYEAAKVIKNRLLLGITSFILANLSLCLAMYPQAIELHQEALGIAKELNDKQGIGAVLGNLGIAYDSLGEYQKAISYYQEALNIAKEIGDKKSEGSLLGNLGNAYYSLGEYQKAISYYQEALNIAKKIGDRQGEGNSLGSLGNAYLSLGEYQKAISYYQEALNIAKEIGDRKGEGSLLGNLGIAYDSLGQYQKAISYYQEALNIAKEIGDRQGEGNWLGNLGNAYLSLGEYQRAIGYYEEALNIAKEIGDRQGEGNRLGNLGSAYRSLGQYQKAISYYQEALNIAKEIGDRQGEGNWLGNLSIAYYSLGQYQKAISYYEDALKIAKEIGDRNSEGRLLGILGNVYFFLGEYQQTIGYFEEALNIAKEIGDRKNEGSLVGNLGIAYFSLGQYQKAIGYFEEALNIAKKIGDKQCEGNSLGNLGNAYDSLGQYQKAISYYQEALNIAKEIGDVDSERIVNLNLGIVYDDHLPQPDKAYNYYHRSIELSESMRGGLIEESHKIGFFGRIEDAYNRIVSLCYKLNKEKEAYEYTERAKSRAFLDLLATTEIKPTVALPPELRQKEDECVGLLRQAQRRPFEETTPKPQIDVIKVNEELEAIYDEIEKYDPEYAFLRSGRPLNLNQIQELLVLAAKESKAKALHSRHPSLEYKPLGLSIALVEYFVIEDAVFIFVIRGDDSSLHIEKKSISGERLYRYIENYFREVANYLEYGDMRQTWQELSQYLIEPIAKYLKKGDIIYIVPHGVLHYLPFHALRYNGRYLIEDFQIVYSPSASLIKYCQLKRIDKFESCLSLGVVFEEEAEMVAKLFNTSAYTGEVVTEDLVQRECKDKDIIHFSCHGLFDHLQPISSGLVLSNDKILSVNDIFGLRLNANLVTLSACETGISDQKPGDELIGLTRGFIYAGTPSVVVSLWSVEAKSTLQLMNRFYTYLINDKMTKVEALQKAQLEIMEMDEYEHPYFWAPFILIGDWK